MYRRSSESLGLGLLGILNYGFNILLTLAISYNHFAQKLQFGHPRDI